MDGAGYPSGLAGEDIPLWGRICAVADVFDAVTSERPYKPAFPNDEAMRILRDGRGSQFDPRVVDVFFERLEEICEDSSRTAILPNPTTDRRANGSCGCSSSCMTMSYIVLRTVQMSS